MEVCYGKSTCNCYELKSKFHSKQWWLQCFRKWHNIPYKIISGEDADVPVTKVNDWKDILPRIWQTLIKLMRLNYILELYQINHKHYKMKHVKWLKKT